MLKSSGKEKGGEDSSHPVYINKVKIIMNFTSFQLFYCIYITYLPTTIFDKEIKLNE